MGQQVALESWKHQVEQVADSKCIVWLVFSIDKTISVLLDKGIIDP